MAVDRDNYHCQLAAHSLYSFTYSRSCMVVVQPSSRTHNYTIVDKLALLYYARGLLASCLIYALALPVYVNFIVWVRSVNKMLPSVKFAEDKVLTFLILSEKC